MSPVPKAFEDTGDIEWIVDGSMGFSDSKEKGMRGLVTAMLVLASAASVCIAEQEYHNKEWHFTVTLGDDWEEISPENIAGKHSQFIYETFLAETDLGALFSALSEEVGDEMDFNNVNYEQLREDAKIDPLSSDKTVAVLQLRGSDDTYNGLMIIQAEVIYEEYRQDAFTPEHYSSQYFRSDWVRNEGFERLKNIDKTLAMDEPKEKWQPVKDGRVLGYYQDSHTYVETTVLKGRANQSFFASMMRTFGSNRIITIVFHARNVDMDEFTSFLEDLRYNIIFDEDYGYGETSAGGVMQALWHWFIWPTIIFIVIFIGLYTWVNS